jgi:glycosyltransferase involved in cell wall biosynthesis
MTRLKVLMSAYACEPGCGSEPGIGWNSVVQAAHVSDLWVMTRANNKGAIEPHTREFPLSAVKWVYIDLPRWMRWWKKGPRGAVLYYCLWQIASYLAARRLHARVRFDCVHHVTMGVYWMPTFLWRLSVPFVWGPVGGGEATPKRYYRSFSPRGRLHEHLRDAVRALSRIQPLVRATARRAGVALATTEETAEQLRRAGAERPLILSHAALPRSEFDRLSRVPIRTDSPFRVISIGRLIHWKGYHLALRAFHAAHSRWPQMEYWFIGDGPERTRLEHLARELGVGAAVRFLGTLPRDQVLDTLSLTDVLLHPSFHDSGGYVCVEAMAAARPVICLDLGGPGQLVSEDTGIKVRAESPEQTVRELADALITLATDSQLRHRLAAAARERVHENYLWQAKGAVFQRLYSLVANVAAEAEPRAT